MSEARRLPEGSRFAVLASGGGTNLQALIDAFPAELAVVAGDRAGAYAFERARRAGIPVEHVAPDAFKDRAEYDAELARRLEGHDVELVVGAGYLRLLSGEFLSRFPAVINVHPSLLPEFKGLRAVERALESGVPETGATVHYVTEELDSGPVIRQESVSIYATDTTDTLLVRLHHIEHRLLVAAVEDHFLGFEGRHAYSEAREGDSRGRSPG